MDAAALARELRRLLHEGPGGPREPGAEGEDPRRELPGLALRAAELLSRPAGPGREAAQAGLCVHLLGLHLRRQRDPALLPPLLMTLAAAGRLGRALAGQRIQARVLPLPQVSALLAPLAPRHLLALVNDMLLDCPAEDKQLAAWLRGLCPAPGRLDAREALLFLRGLAQEEAGPGSLAAPLREALAEAGLPASLSRALAGAPGAATAEALLQAARLLDDADLDAAALEHSLLAAGAAQTGGPAGGPGRLAALLSAPADTPGLAEARQAELRCIARGPDAGARLPAAAGAEPEAAGRVLAEMLAGGRAPEALRLLPLLPGPGVQACLAALPPRAQPAARARLVQALALLEPEFLKRAARRLGPSHGLDDASGPAGRALAELLSAAPAHGGAALLDATAWQAAAPAPAGPDQPPPRAAQSRKTQLDQALAEALTPLREADFSHSTVQGRQFEGVGLMASDLSRNAWRGVTLRRARLSGCRLDQGLFEGCLFQGCVFKDTDFSGARFSGCRFEDCALEGCTFGRTTFEGCALDACALTECGLAGARLRKTRLSACSLKACALSGAVLAESALLRLELLRCDLSGGLWERCAWRECQALGSSLSATRLAGCECLELELTRCPAPGLEVAGGHTDSPLLARAARSMRGRILDAAAGAGLASAVALCADPVGGPFARACLEAWLRVDEARRSLCAMRGRDRVRRALALSRLDDSQGQFLRLLPALLATDAFERARGLSAPACALAGHARHESPRRDILALLERRLPGAGGLAPARAPELSIEAVYAMGSLGSVAQGPGSDLDCWVCVRELEHAGPQAMEELGRKLCALEDWALAEFGLETHFFPMRMEQVRANRFGTSDRESSGSAQAALLKEEFCRTALRLAGKDLLWWAAPQGADQAGAQALLGELAMLDPRTAAELADLGQPRPIPPEEFFGASLWQMVKALHKPYKSVLKLGLLERCAGLGPRAPLLCDRVKESALRGCSGAAELDPYLLLFAAITEHYRGLGDAPGLELLDECLRLKTGGAREEGADLEAAFRRGALVSRFMVSAYGRIQEGLKGGAGAAHISPEDLTRLGRRIAANFAQRPHKVELVPFLGGGLSFTEFCFFADKAPGRRPVWGVKGKTPAAGKAAVESLPPLRRDQDLPRLLAWLLFNGLYDPRQAIHAETSLAPLAVVDLQQLLSDMALFFPLGETLEPDMDRSLEDEAVLRAYLLANLAVPQDKNRLVTLSVVYATNWGEVFCQSFENPPQTLPKSPLPFLREALGKPLAMDAVLRAYAPRKSACPRIVLV